MAAKTWDELEPWERANRLGNPFPRGTLQSRPNNPPLCSQCTHGQVTRRQSEVRVYCHDIEQFVPPDITECSCFSAKNQASLEDMTKIALLIDPRELPGQKQYL
jgi:hypothetical protein